MISENSYDCLSLSHCLAVILSCVTELHKIATNDSYTIIDSLRSAVQHVVQ